MSLAPSPSSTARTSIVFARAKVALAPMSASPVPNRSDPPRITVNTPADPLRALIIFSGQRPKAFLFRPPATAVTFCEQA